LWLWGGGNGTSKAWGRGIAVTVSYDMVKVKPSHLPQFLGLRYLFIFVY
jgi:hypothetical protein